MCRCACVCKHGSIYILEISICLLLDANQIATKLSGDTVTRQPVLVSQSGWAVVNCGTVDLLNFAQD